MAASDQPGTTVTQASTVTLHFSLSLTSGELIDSNFDAKPASFSMGDGNLLPGFESVLVGMREDQRATYTIAAADAFGESSEENFQRFSRRELEPLAAGLPDDVRAESNSDDTSDDTSDGTSDGTSDESALLVPGLVLTFTDAAKGELAGVVDRIEADDVYVNFNHPLAGRDIVFDVHIIDIAQTDS